MRVVSNQHLNWRGDRLYFGRRLMVMIVPDATYPTMWRVRRLDGALSDMVNKTRARDAARATALSILNTKETAVQAPQTA